MIGDVYLTWFLWWSAASSFIIIISSSLICLTVIFIAVYYVKVGLFRSELIVLVCQLRCYLCQKDLVALVFHALQGLQVVQCLPKTVTTDMQY